MKIMDEHANLKSSDLGRAGRGRNHHPCDGVIFLGCAIFHFELSAHKIGGGRVGRSARPCEVRRRHADSIPVIGKRPRSDNCPCAVRVALGDARGAILRVVGMGVSHTVFNATSHIAVGVVSIRVRRSRFGADAGHGMRDARAVGVRPREPAGLIGGLGRRTERVEVLVHTGESLFKNTFYVLLG